MERGFVMTDADAAQAAADRAAQTAAMLAQADVDAWIEGIAADSAIVDCTECQGSGVVRFSTGWSLGDWIEEACTWCAGTGTVAITEAEAA